MAKKDKIMETPSEKTIKPEDQEALESQKEEGVIPIQLIFHVAGVDVTKTQTPMGQLTEMSIISPTGIAVTVRMSDKDVGGLVEQLTGLSGSNLWTP